MIDQIGIAIFGLSAVWLSQDHRAGVRRWAPIIGMISQPFWFYSSWSASQWGIFLCAIVYTIAWARGIYNQWIRS